MFSFVYYILREILCHYQCGNCIEYKKEKNFTLHNFRTDVHHLVAQN